VTRPTDEARTALLRAVRAILRPLVRQLIARGVTYPSLGRLLREVYIEVGTAHFTLPFKKQTDSRVALLTGITRKQIGQIRRGQARRRRPAVERDAGLAARVVGRWRSGPPYAASDGTPRLLRYESPGGASFVDLVAELGGDIPPRAVLDELLRAGAAALTPRGDVHLTDRAEVGAQRGEEALTLLETDAAELIEAIASHVEQPADGSFLRRRVSADNIGAETLPALRTRVGALGDEFARAAERALRTGERAASSEAGTRAVVAVYYFEAPARAPRGRRE
jgi:hypothetical protein